MTKNKYALTLLLIVAALLRMVGLSGQSFTMDECLETETAEMTVRQIMTAANSFPPLYHLLLKGWLYLDPSPIGARTFSFAVGIVSVWAVWKLVAEAINEKAGLIAAGLTAVSPFHIYYSQQGRGYILYILLSTLAMLYGLRILRGPTKRDRIAFVVVSVFGGYTHYYFSLVLVSIGVGVIAIQGMTYFAKNIIPLATVIGLACSPLVVLLPGDLEYQRDLREPRPANVAAIGYTFFSFESGYTLGPARSQLHTMTGRSALMAALPWIVVIGILVLPLLLTGAANLLETRELPYWISLLVVPFFIVVLLCHWLGVTYNTRFVVGCWIPYCALMASGLTRFSWKPRIAALLLLASVYAVALFHRQFVPGYQNEDVRQVAEFLDAAPPRPVFVCAGYMVPPLHRYLKNTGPVIRLKDRSFAEGSESTALQTIREHEASFWLVYCREFHGDPDGVILRTLQRDRKIQLAFAAAGVRVFAGGNESGFPKRGPSLKTSKALR